MPSPGTGRGTGLDDGQCKGEDVVVRRVLDLQSRVLEEDVVDEVEECLADGRGGLRRGSRQWPSGRCAVGCTCARSGAERSTGNATWQMRSRTRGKREELVEQRALRGVLGGVDDGELEVVEDVHQNEAELGFEQKAVVMNSRRSAA